MSKYPPGHPLYQMYNKKTVVQSSFEQSPKQKQEPDMSISSVNQSKAILKLENNTGCCDHGLCKSEFLFCQTNLCFVNLIAQLFDSIEDFHLFFQSDEWINHPNKKTQAVILSELEFILSSKREENTSTAKLRYLVANAAEKPQMKTGEMQDAEEFLSDILNQIEIELVFLGVTNPVTDRFKFQERKQRRFLSTQGVGACPYCHNLPKDQDEPAEKVLRLPVPNHSKRNTRLSRQKSPPLSLSNLITEYYSEKDQEPMKCSNCCSHQNTKCPLTGICTKTPYSEQKSMIYSPDILLIQLMRFDGSDNKIMTTVIPEDILTLPHGEKYEIVSIGDHIGSRIDQGHYVLQSFKSSTWITCNDSRNYPSKEPKSSDNYLFAYKKICKETNPSIECTAPNSEPSILIDNIDTEFVGEKNPPNKNKRRNQSNKGDDLAPK